MLNWQISIGKTLFIFISLGTSIVVKGQINGRIVEQSLTDTKKFTITQYSTKEGLPQNQINEIIAKTNGALVLSTTNGIVEFNGYDFKQPQNLESIRKVNFHKLYWSEKHQILSGKANDGQFYTVSPTFKLINPAEKYRENIRNANIQGDTVILISRSGKLFVGTLPDLEMKEICNTTIKSSNCVYYQPPYFYIGAKDGLYRIDDKIFKTEKIKNEETTALKLNPFNHQIYILTKGNLYQLRKDTVVSVFKFDTKTDEEFASNITFSDSNNLFVSTLKGIYWINNGQLKILNAEDGLLTNQFASIYYYQPENCLFAGSFDKGLLKLQFKEASSYSKSNASEISSLNSLLLTSEGKLIAAKNCCNLIEFTNDTLKNYTDIRANYSVLAFINNSIWAGTWGTGVKIIKDKKVVFNIAKPNLPNNSVHAIYKDTDENVWIGSNEGIAFGQTPENIKPLFSTIITGKISLFYELKNKTICIGGEDGVFFISNKKIIKILSAKDGIRGKEVRSLYEDAEGKIWIGTYGGGIYCYNKGQLTSINNMPGCRLDKDAFCFAEDTLGYLYISSNKGLWRVSKKSLDSFYIQKTKYLIPFLYTEEAGILNTEFNGGFQNNYLTSKSGHIYFPTIEGLVKVNTSTLKFRKLIITINDVLINDSLITTNTKVFNRNTSLVKFNFSCTNFNSLYNIYFQHKLIGEKSYEWSSPQKLNAVNLRLLAPGKYTFMVRALDGFNDPAPNEAKFEFEIKPYFYETLWFKIIITLLFLMLTILITIWRINELRRKTKLKEQYSHKLAEIELKAIQAQLNPHFLFNCMNTMKYFILEKNYQKANESLNKISYLVRNSLENSDKIFVSLNEKIKFITNYIELEKMRLAEDLDYTITCDDTIDKLTPVPNFIIQPYIENAIKHGINNLESKKGVLTIIFEKQENTLTCIITDNGIGRKASFERNKNNFLHISKGTTLTVEKASFLKAYNNYNCEISITDLYDEKELALGTKVTITMPLNDNSRNN
jgi:ligand-binding sensor domain-containing protein